ncbi:hypothetical protein ACFLTA_05960, partial [Bacteroidota bacterium]
AFLIPWIPQFIYWKEVSGSILYNSYSEVGSAFYFGNPHIMDLLFSYRKGWFVYTPLMLFAVIGFLSLFWQRRGLFYGTVIYLAVMVYVFSSWWSWWTGGSFGIRSMVDLMPVMAIPLAALLTALLKQKIELRNGIAAILVFLMFLNVFQSWQYQHVLIHWVGMTKKSYWSIFLSSKDRYGYWQNLTEPDYELARQGIYIYYPVIGKDEKLLEMDEEEGKEYVEYYLSWDRRLKKDIKRYARRNETSVEETYDMVINRAYERMTD